MGNPYVAFDKVDDGNEVKQKPLRHCSTLPVRAIIAINDEMARLKLEQFGIKWDKKYPVISDIWQRNWSGIIPFFAFPKEIRKIIYTTFEIQSITNIVAVNLYLENENNGILLHYNLQPDDNMKKAYSVEHTGYPYPLHILQEIDKIELKTKKGAFYFLNANNRHAVKVNEKSKNLRTTVSWLMGFKDDFTVLYWI